MTPREMAVIHARAFAPQRGWTTKEFESLCSSSTVTCLSEPHAFALVRTICDETELLTIATDPDAQRRGHAETLLRDWLTGSSAHRAFLEVSATNAAAYHLYEKLGFAEYGRRKAYYALADGTRSDAVMMQKALTSGNDSKSFASTAKTG